MRLIRGLRPFSAGIGTSHQEFRWCCTIATSHRTRIKAPPNNWEKTVLDHQYRGSISYNHIPMMPTRGSSRIGERWMEFQGVKDWEGLLDPLDDDLRDEIIRYGNFVEAAYQAFNFDPTSPAYATCKYLKSSMLAWSDPKSPITRYRVTKNLRATSGISVPPWMEKAPSWMRVESSWIGYVAVCHDKEEISRLGRRDVVIALRGTATCLEWLENIRATLNHCHLHGPRLDGLSDCPMVESGFQSLYTSGTSKCPSLQYMIREEIIKLLHMYGDEPLSLTITGHSLGAALAILAAYDIKTTIKHAPHVTVFSFGGPRVGNTSFQRHVENQGTKILRIVNSDDLITKVPGFIIEDHDDPGIKQDIHTSAHLSCWIRERIKETQWVYADVGRELRLSSRDSPHLNNIDVATCHDLKTYLHLVNGFVSSTCPFRASARRFHEQTSTT